MTLRHLQIFTRVCETKNITHAAETLHMTQPAVTRAIRELESYYGVCLFDRINRRLTPTDCGSRLYTQAVHILDCCDMMEKGMRSWDAAGVLRIGASITIGNILLPELAAQFRKSHPQVQLQVLISNGASLQQALMKNQLDLALIEGGGQPPELHAEPLFTDRIVLITPPGHPLLQTEQLRLADTAGYPILLREPGSVGRALLDQTFSLRGLPLRPVWESVSTQALVKAVARGLGISFLPEQLVRRELQTGAVCTREISDADFTRPNMLVYHRDKFLTGTMQAFISMFRSECSADPSLSDVCSETE